jgi:hypothetical protein
MAAPPFFFLQSNPVKAATIFDPVEKWALPENSCAPGDSRFTQTSQNAHDPPFHRHSRARSWPFLEVGVVPRPSFDCDRHKGEMKMRATSKDQV